MTMTRRLFHRGVALPSRYSESACANPSVNPNASRIVDAVRAMRFAMASASRAWRPGEASAPPSRPIPAEHRQAILLCFRTDAFIRRKNPAGNECHQFIENADVAASLNTVR